MPRLPGPRYPHARPYQPRGIRFVASMAADVGKDRRLPRRAPDRARAVGAALMTAIAPASLALARHRLSDLEHHPVRPGSLPGHRRGGEARMGRRQRRPRDLAEARRPRADRRVGRGPGPRTLTPP